MTPRLDFGAATAIGLLTALVVGAAGWATHIFWLIKLLMTSDSVAVGKVVIAIIGAFFPPFGAVHGIWLWFN